MSSDKTLSTGSGFAEASKPHYHGHRERMREKFRMRGGDAFADYELLEMILFRTVRQGDTKPMAKALLAEFGSLPGVFAADVDALKKIHKVGDAIATDLKVIGSMLNRSMRSSLQEQPILSSWSSVVDYCKHAMAHERVEQFRILFLDKKNRLKADEVQQTGTIDHTPVYPREVVKRALELDSSAIILVHNHPSGDPTPSRADIDMTKLIIEAAAPMGITIHDHIIIGRDDHVSMKGLQLI